ncbi:hypothetical protein [Candidatus Leptofilum sp.]|uniref:hypothetical protein n=1 Tax=Candidatus Leptofilum sp. TaxID=3241576 RepID=UPI003B5B6D0C
MFRVAYRAGLLLGAVILALFIGARVINVFDPYRILTEQLIAEVAAEPQRTVQLNSYGSQAVYLRQTLKTEEAAAFANWLDQSQAVELLELVPAGTKVRLIVAGVDTAVHQIATFDDDLAEISEATSLSHGLAQLRVYDLDNGDAVLSDLYRQSQTVSGSLADVSDGLGDVAKAVSTVTELPALETIQQEAWEWQSFFTNLASNGLMPQAAATIANDAAELVGLVYWGIESWQGVPANMLSIKQRIDLDVAWLDDFEQRYQQAKLVNDRWQFDTLRLVSSFVAENHQPLLLGLVGSLLLALAGWVGSRERATLPQPVPRQTAPQPVRSRPSLAFHWADGRTDHQTLPSVGELTVGNIVIRRARVRYYLEQLDNAFPTLLNGQTINGARTLNDGDVLQIGELQTVFQLAG